jgi:hypothetical protein
LAAALIVEVLRRTCCGRMSMSASRGVNVDQPRRSIPLWGTAIPGGTTLADELIS